METTVKTNVRTNATKETKRKKKHSGLWALIALAAAIVVFIILLMIQKNVAEGDREFYKEVWVANREIPEGTYIDGSNIENYFKTAVMDTRVIPQKYIDATSGSKDIVEIIGKTYVDHKYLENDVITPDGFKVYNAREGLKDPVEVSFAVGGVDAIVAGTIREGDKINVFAVESAENSVSVIDEKYTVRQLYSNKIVTNSFTGDGSIVGVTDSEGNEDDTPVTMVTIFIERGEEEAFFKTLATGSIRVSRVAELDADTEE